MAAESGRRGWYQSQVLPLGGGYGDSMHLPEAPAFVNPPSQSFLYPGSGDEPVPAG